MMIKIQETLAGNLSNVAVMNLVTSEPVMIIQL